MTIIKIPIRRRRRKPIRAGFTEMKVVAMKALALVALAAQRAADATVNFAAESVKAAEAKERA